jgi:proline dehydrogenase
MSLFNRLLVTSLPLVPKAIVGRVAARYVAGETLDDALRIIRKLNAEGAMATLDVLGEEVSERGKATASTDEYVRALQTIAAQQVDSNVSIKPTMLGLKIDEGFCRDNIERIVATAKEHGNFVRIDMEDRTTTDATLRMYRDLQARYGNVGVVLQAYMRRTLRDIAELPKQGANVRICKGIYVEPRPTAWSGFDTRRANYLQALEKMIAFGVYPAIATHDEYLVCQAVAMVDKHGLSREQYEFQMLLGVDDQLRKILLEEGHRLRVYVPYGRDWYPYSIRRLRENPEVARHVLRAMLSGR